MTYRETSRRVDPQIWKKKKNNPEKHFLPLWWLWKHHNHRSLQILLISLKNIHVHCWYNSVNIFGHIFIKDAVLKLYIFSILLLNMNIFKVAFLFVFFVSVFLFDYLDYLHKLAHHSGKYHAIMTGGNVAPMRCDVVAAMQGVWLSQQQKRWLFNLIHLIDSRMLTIYSESSLVWTVCTAALF